MAQKYFKQDGNLIIVESAYKDGEGNNIVSQYSTKEELTATEQDLLGQITEISSSLGNDYYKKSETYTRSEIETRDAAVQKVIDLHISPETNPDAHTSTAEKAKLTVAYDHSGKAGIESVHHNVTPSKLKEGKPDEHTAVTSIDDVNLAATYDILGNSITSEYATKAECDKKYEKPTAGIDTKDLASGVVASLGKADAAQPAIEDLDTIRSGAAAGATAVLPAGLSDYATLKWVEDKHYLTAHQDISGKVEKEITGYNGKAIIFNEADGGGAKFETKDNKHSFVGVNDGGITSTGIAALIYAVDMNTAGYLGAKLDVTLTGMYYTTGLNSGQIAADRDKPANEIATKKDIPDLSAYATKSIVSEQIAAEASARDAAIDTAKAETQSWAEGTFIKEHQDISGKVDGTIQTAAGKALVFNEADGGGIKFESSTNWSAVSANDGGSGIGAQAYNWKMSGNTPQEGSTLDVTQGKIYYYNGAYTSAANRDIAGNEIARIKNIPTLDTLVTTEQLEAKFAVGAITAGTKIPPKTSLSSLLKMIFEGTSTSNNFYYGTLKNLPTSDADIKSASTMTAVELTDINRGLLLTGYAVQLEPNHDYVVFAIEQTAGLVLTDIFIGTELGDGDIATLADTATLHVYCLGDSSKLPAKYGEGEQETYTFVCSTN